jgi:hypothetical protein
MTTSLELPNVRLAGRGGLVRKGKREIVSSFAESMGECSMGAFSLSFPFSLLAFSLARCFPFCLLRLRAT